jgi:type IV secretory pathway component VirB8
MATDEELEKELQWTLDNQRGDARATAAAGIAVLRAIRRFDRSSSRLAWVMAVMTFFLVVLTIVLVWLTSVLLHRSIS